jgi:hypothetical protein
MGKQEAQLAVSAVQGRKQRQDVSICLHRHSPDLSILCKNSIASPEFQRVLDDILRREPDNPDEEPRLLRLRIILSERQTVINGNFNLGAMTF